MKVQIGTRLAHVISGTEYGHENKWIRSGVQDLNDEQLSSLLHVVRMQEMHLRTGSDSDSRADHQSTLRFLKRYGGGMGYNAAGKLVEI